MRRARIIQYAALLVVAHIMAGCGNANSKVCTVTPLSSGELVWTPFAADASPESLDVFASAFEHRAIPGYELVFRVYVVDADQSRLVASSYLSTADPHQGVAIFAHEIKNGGSDGRIRHAFAAGMTTAKGRMASSSMPIELTLDGAYKVERSSSVIDTINLVAGKEMFLATMLFASPEAQPQSQRNQAIDEIIAGSPASQAIDRWMENFKSHADANELPMHLADRAFVFATAALLPAGELDREGEAAASGTLSQP